MKLETSYPVSISFTRRCVDFDSQRPDHDSYSDFNMELTVKCERSHRNILRLVTTGGGLLSALANLSGVPATVELTDSFPLFGKVREYCEIPIREQKTKMAVPPLPKKYQEGGWKYQNGYNNSNCRVVKDGVTYYKCSLVRYVDFVEDEEEQDE
ncbi:hypothetical protein LU11_gp005 [Pseudomonas phage Lu11]|uniref:hypothetical protein n=1 Tax=Pseudomonas phage Lu11 TaxID=1161927 RepID=UPI00025F14DF|nr:hypothetical protein LU11_gp005 [Pseudomonas phage Lu11]AFH14536.1 hypothetical protein Lu11_0005 [Pseudomonas phage Lu11]